MMAQTIEENIDATILSLDNLDIEKATSLNDLLGLSPVKNDVERLTSVKMFQCGEFKYPDVSSLLNKILDSSIALNQDEDFPSLQGGCLSVSPYNPHFDEVFQLSSRTPDVSPFRHQPHQPQRFPHRHGVPCC